MLPVQCDAEHTALSDTAGCAEREIRMVEQVVLTQ